MAITVFLSTTLRDSVPGYNPIDGLALACAAPMTVVDLARSIGLPVPEIKIVMINGRRHEMDALVKDGDRVGFFPAVGGG